MAISINWGTSVINVPKTDLTLVQATPTEIYNMELNWFRLQLKDLEDNEMGISYLKTHDHNTEVQLGGLTFARVIEILDPYTVTFEDGQYAVNLIGANSNVGDKVNVNQVSVRSQNSAGLISTPLIEYASFEGGVSWDYVNGTASTLFPAGTRLQPTKLLSDVKIIADYRGFKKIYVLDDAELDSGLNFDDFIIEGDNHTSTQLVVNTNASVHNTVFKNLWLSGVLDGNNELSDCVVENLEYVNGHIHNCGLIGQITLAGGIDAIMVNCVTLDPYDPPIIDIGYSGQNLAMPNYAGLVTIENLNGPNFIGIGLNAGQVTVDSATVLSGILHVSGIGDLVDEEGNTINTGLWNGGVTVINNTVNPEHISTHVWDYYIASGFEISGTAGYALNNVSAGADPAAIADAVWDESRLDHTTADTFGAKNQNLVPSENVDDYKADSVNINYSGIADAVWDEDLTDHNLANTFGSKNQLGVPSENVNDYKATEVSVSASGIADAVWDESRADHISVGSFGEKNQLGVPSENLDDYKADTVDVNYSGISAAVWDAQLSGYQDSGSAGEALSNVSAGADPAQIADAVWDEVTADHTGQGTYGHEVATKADLAAAGSTTHTIATSGVLNSGISNSGSYTSTFIKDGTYWDLSEDSSNGLNVEFTFNIPSGQEAGTVSVTGRYTGFPTSTHYQNLWIYNYNASAWELLNSNFMPGGQTSDDTYMHEYYERHIDRSNNEVKVQLRHNEATYNPTHDLYLDYVNVTSIEVVTAEDIANAVWANADGVATVSGIEQIRQVEMGRWKIENNQMIFYEEDNTTEIMRFNLFDENGDPASTDIYDRQRT